MKASQFEEATAEPYATLEHPTRALPRSESEVGLDQFQAKLNFVPPHCLLTKMQVDSTKAKLNRNTAVAGGPLAGIWHDTCNSTPPANEQR